MPRHAVRLAQGVGSQGLSSLSNFALTVAVARTSTPEQFGAFVIAHSLSVLVIPIVRSAVGETLAVTEHRGREGMGAGALAGIVIAVALAVGAVVSSGPLAGWMAAFALAVPLMVLQDTARSVAFAKHTPSVAALSDGVWLAVQAAGWTVAIVAGYGSVEVLFAIWVAGCLTGTVAVTRTVEVPSVPAGAQWLRAQWRVVSSLTVDSLLAMAPSNGTLYLLGIVAGLPAAGALRGMETLYGPVRAALLGIRAVGLPEASRRKDAGRSYMMRYLMRLSAGLAGFAALAMAVMVLLPDSVGQLVLAEVWQDASTVALPAGLSIMALAALTGVRLALRSLHAVRDLLVLRTVTVILVTVSGMSGAVLGGLQGAAWGLAVAQGIAVVLGWTVAVRAPDQATGPTRIRA